MDAGLLWTIVGSAAAVVAIPAGVVIGVLQLRQGGRAASLPSLAAQPDAAADADGDLAGLLLPPPVGRLAAEVRGRDQLIEMLIGLAAAPDGSVHVLAGFGGCGKSTVALEAAQRAKKTGSRVWWVPAVDQALVTGLLLGLARQLGAADPEMREALEGRVNPSDVLWQQLEAARGWMLVLDNADDLAALTIGDRAASDGAGWLRPTRAGLVLVTSRTSDQQAWGPLAQVHRVGPLDNGAAGHVLADLAPGAGDATAARALAGRLGGLPLALHQAGSYLASPFAAEQTFAGYGQAMTERFGELMGRGDDDRARVIGTWELSLDALAAQGRGQASALLRVLSCFADGVPIQPELLDLAVLNRVCGGRPGAEDGLSGLLAVGLIDTLDPGQRAGRPPVVVHPLVTETIRHQAADALAESFAVAVELLATASRLNQAGHRDREGWLTLLPHMRALLGLAVTAPPEVLEELAQSAAAISEALLWTAGPCPESLEIAESALQRTAGLGGDHHDVLVLRSLRASVRLREYRASQAEAEYQQILDIQLRTLGPDHPDTLVTRGALAAVHTFLARRTAVDEYRQVLEARVRILGPDHPDTLQSRNHVASALAYLKMSAEAEAEYKQVLNEQLRILGPDDWQTLLTRSEIIGLLRNQGRYAEAEAQYRQIFDSQMRVLGPDDPGTLRTQWTISKMLGFQRRTAEAEAGYRQLLHTHLRVLGPDHEYTLRVRTKIAEMVDKQGHTAEAEAEYRQILDVQLRVLGPDHDDILETRHYLACTLADQGRDAEAEAEEEHVRRRGHFFPEPEREGLKRKATMRGDSDVTSHSSDCDLLPSSLPEEED